MSEVALQPGELDPSWFRWDTGGPKGHGWLGDMPQTSGPSKGKISSELSIGVEVNGKEMEVPSMVPSLTQKEKDHLLSGGDPGDMPSIIQKATQFAEQRVNAGKSPFASGAESPGYVKPEAGNPYPQDSVNAGNLGLKWEDTFK